jgi:hypothetical protein
MSVREIGGNKFKKWLGDKLISIGNKFVNKGKKMVISNVSSTFINPFTIMFTFTVDATKKYQLIKQGDYTEKYKALGESEDTGITEDEMFLIILTHKKQWFHKRKIKNE